MTDKEIIDAGFYVFSPSEIKSANIEKCFQKRYDDEYGKKYFITINKWKAMRHLYTGILIDPSYEYETQLYKKGSHDPIDLLFHHGWSINDVECYMQAMWNTGLFEHYETFTEN